MEEERILQTQDVCGDGGLLKRVLKAGSGALPRLGAKVKIRYTGSLAECKGCFDSALAEFHLGEGQVIIAWDKGVGTMQKGEVAVLVCRADYAFGEAGRRPDVPAHAAVKYEVELLSFQEPEREAWELSAADRLEQAEKLKARGTEDMRAAKWEAARQSYREAAGLLDGFSADATLLFTEREALDARARAARLACLLNEAMAELKLDEFASAESACTAALAIDPTSVKALYRRGCARTGLSSFTEARCDLRHANRLDPNNKDVRAAFDACVARARGSRERGDQASWDSP
jgi:tetratricopeptide (TPR) repeat protein